MNILDPVTVSVGGLVFGLLYMGNFVVVPEAHMIRSHAMTSSKLLCYHVCMHYSKDAPGMVLRIADPLTTDTAVSYPHEVNEAGFCFVKPLCDTFINAYKEIHT